MNKYMKYLMARSREGIKIRLWFAVGLAVISLLINLFYIKPEYDRLPQVVPVFFDMYGNIAEWGHRSMLNDFAEIRIIFFVIMLLVGWGCCKVKGGGLLGRRLQLLVVDIANLVIMTGVGMTLVYIEIAKGDETQTLSEHWEYTVMLFWLVIFIIEYVTDKPHLK